MQQSSNYHRIIDFFKVERLLANDAKMDVEIIVKMAPANRDEKRRYLEAERNKVIQESIANGDAAYHFQNAGARSFMREAEQEFKPEFERILGDALRAAGF